MNMKKKVYVKGYFFNNFGDDIFLYILITRYPGVDFYVFLNKKRYKHFQRFKNLHIIDSNNRINNKLYNYYKKTGKQNILSRLCDYSVMIGGSIFMEKYCNLDELKKIYENTQYYILGANIGPYYHEEYLEYVKEIIAKSCDICVRDIRSYELIKDNPNARYGGDIAFGLCSEKEVEKTKKIFISVMNLEIKDFSREQQQFYENIISSIIEEYHVKKYEIVVASFCEREQDNIMVQKIKQRFPYVRELYYRDNLCYVVEQIQSSEVVIATRFHAMVLGFLYAKKVIPLIYNSKMKNLLEDIRFQNEMYDIINMKKIDGKDQDYKDVDISGQKSTAENHFKKLDNILRC